MKDSNVRTKSQALAIYLFWLKTGLNQEAIKAHFKIENRTDVSRYCEQVRAALTEYFVPNYLGCESLRRDQWVIQNSTIATELYSLSNDQLVVIADGTYIYCQKSSNNFFQRKSYSCQKKRPLVKPFLFCTTNGYNINAYGPIQSRHSGNSIYKVYVSNFVSGIESGTKNDTLINGWYCTCKNGTRTGGCCSHISSIIYYFGYARYLEHIPRPAAFLSDIFPNVFRESTDDGIDEPTQGTQNKRKKNSQKKSKSKIFSSDSDKSILDSEKENEDISSVTISNEKINSYSSHLIDKNEWNKAKSIWIVDVLKKTTNKNGVYDLFGDQTEVDIFLQTQQTYESFLTCPCGRNHSFRGEIISFVKNGTEVSISIKKIKCNRCSKITIVNTKFLLQEIGPLFLIINNSSMLELNGSELDKEIEINEEKYLLIFFTVFKENHYMGVYNIKNSFIVYTDASGYATCGVLSQRDENGNEYVICYGSRLLKNAEIHYGITEKECLAVVWAIKRYRVYLYGTYFEVITDHSALKWLMSINDPTARLAGWAIYLQAYQFAIIHREGNGNGNADALSRPVLLFETCNKVSKEEKEDISLKNSDIYDDENSLYYLKTGKMKPGLSRKQVNRIKKLTENMVYDNETEVIYYVKKTGEYVEIPPKEKRKELMKIAHEFGHFQWDTTLSRLKESYFWFKMMDDVKKGIQACVVCKKNQLVGKLDHPAKCLKVSGIFDKIGIDLVMGFPITKEGFIGLLVIVEFFTKFPYAVPIKSKTALEIAEHLWQFFCLFGPAKEILSDQGTEFVNEVVNSMINKMGCKHIVTSPYHLRTNGQCERFNREIVTCLRKK
ncbi:unnamed protein product [Brachionus calyciflorus]|uniref:Integrase catalytic domain-containing protein n=1 Tax=Brachionus calyciflorus TaxID=104777 RepID=A0A813VMQ8_9BILA|nr:unnamed protein product [Brachionus calyciflorus]